MNAKECLNMLREIKDVVFSTVDEEGKPQARYIDVMLVEDEKLYFCTARGKDFYRQLVRDGSVAVTGMNKEFQTVRLSGVAERLEESEQHEWIDRIFEANPVMNGVYPGDSRYVLEAFCISEGTGEFFDLGKEPVDRESFSFGGTSGGASEGTKVKPAGFLITDRCIQCGRCERACPQQCITDFVIDPAHCLHCGLCSEVCPVQAIERLGD